MSQPKIRLVPLNANVQVQAVKSIGTPALEMSLVELADLKERQHAIHPIHVQNLLEHIAKDAIQVMEGRTAAARVLAVSIQRKPVAQLEQAVLVFY